MEKYVINGGSALKGVVKIQSAKNSVLPILAATVLTDGKITVRDVPDIIDVRNMVKMLGCLGCRTTYCGCDVTIDASSAFGYEMPSVFARELRSSVFLLGSVVSRFRKAKIAYPGGCDIGLRPIDIHLAGLKRLGVKITEENGYICCRCDKLVGNEIMLDFPSVGATENIMLAAVKAEGITTIKNAAREPEIEDLQRFLNAIGARVSGAGSGTVVVEGVSRLYGGSFCPVCDRIEAGTFLVAAAMCGGEVELDDINSELLSSLLHKLRENGCKIWVEDGKIYLKSDRKLRSVKNIDTQPYPGFPTDLQPQMTALCSISRGHSIITENLFETRFKYVSELKKMGADITVIGRNAFVRGVGGLHGAELLAHDLRGGAAIILAALAAEGKSEVLDISHVDRGYSDFEYKLRAIGGDIVRIAV